MRLKHPTLLTFVGMKQKFLNIWSFIKDLFAEFNADNCFQLAAALSYYTLFSLAPMLIIVISVAGYFFGEQAIQGEIQAQISDLIGPEGALAVQSMIESVYLDGQDLVPTVIGTGTLLFTATLAFTSLQDSLNRIWKVRLRQNSGILSLVVRRVLSFAMVIGTGFLLMVSLTIHSILQFLSSHIQQLFDEYSIYLIKVMELGLSFIVITLLFAMIFKFLPDVRIKWKNVMAASLLTAFLFSVGKFLIGWQVGNSDLTNTYGAAASIVGIILWINYSALILFLGAEFIYVYIKRDGGFIRPNRYAERIHYGRPEEAVQPAPPA
jgi:membrane protein